MWWKNVQSNGGWVIDVSNMKRDMAVTRINYCYFYYFLFYDREFIIIMYCKSVLINAFVLDEVIRIMAEVAISPWVKELIRRFE
jgi:hypothetical protein